MKKSPKKLIIWGTAATAAAMSFTGCKHNYAPAVYGPPEAFTTPAPEESSFDPTEEIPEVVYGPPEWFEDQPVEFDPSENVVEDVYGPPAWFEEGPEETEEETAPADITEPFDDGFSAEDNVIVTVYGPPGSMGMKSK
ncbi:MAG: hypothetical protein IIY96_02885 [Lachnospiraceae bacterium]|nr:hypothetical protein [Lachnospiraceae bacterium]